MQETVKQDREKYIGGSDIPVIMNLSPFKSRFDLLLEKAGYKENDFDGNIYTEYGNTLEPKIRDYINSMRIDNQVFVEGKHTREAQDNEIIGARCHTDGESETTILEIKTTSTVYKTVSEYKIYLVQLLFYMLETGKTNGLLAVYERPEDLSEDFEPDRLQLFDIVLDDYKELCLEIAKDIAKFIEDLVKVKDNPFITEDELLPSDITDITARILAFEDQIKYMKSIEAQIKSEKERLKKAMIAANVKSWKTPNGYKITLVADGEDKITQKLNETKLKDEEPKIYNKYLEDKITKGKAGYILITAPKAKEA